MRAVGYPHSISKFAVAQQDAHSEWDTQATVFAVVADVEASILHVCRGNACNASQHGHWQQYRLHAEIAAGSHSSTLPALRDDGVSFTGRPTRRPAPEHVAR